MYKNNFAQVLSSRGKAPHRPDLMLAIVLFELRRGQRQPSQWYRDTLETYPLWWLSFGIRPSRSCWYEFRDRAGADVDTLNAQLLHLAVERELTRAERGALDGSAVAANASRRRLINQERLEQRLEQLQAATEDEAEDPGEVQGWMAKTASGRAHQYTRYGQAQEQLAKRQATNAQRPASQRQAPDKILVSPGDPQAPLGLDKDGVFRPLYTVQTVRDVTSPLILGYDVFAQASDAATLPPMLQRSQQLTGCRLKELLVDSGYVTGMDLAECAAQDVTLYGPWKANDWSVPKTCAQFGKDQFKWHGDLDAYACPAGHLLKRVSCHTRRCSGGRKVVEWQYLGEAQTCQDCPLRQQCTTSQKGGRSVQRSEHEELIQAHRAWMETAEAKAVYRLSLPRSYRMKYGIPRSQPLTARATTERRRQVVQATRPWEKTPRYRKGYVQNGTASPESEGEAVQEKTEEPVAVAPVQPKRHRKAMPKKQTPPKPQVAG